MRWCWLLGHHFLPIGEKNINHDPFLVCTRCRLKSIPRGFLTSDGKRQS